MNRRRMMMMAACLFAASCEESTSPAPESGDTEGADDDDDDDASDGDGSGPGTSTTTPGTSTTPSDPSTGSESSDSGSDDDASTSGPSDPGAPVILDLSSNITGLTPTAVVRITAIVTDPDGIEDVIGGSLTDESGDITYGALATASQEGAYAIELTWDEINLADPLSFTGSESRTFIVVFFDTAGHETTASIDLSFSCEEGDGACDGLCQDLNTSIACGSCDQQCGADEACAEDTCVQNLGCHPLGVYFPCESGQCHGNGSYYACTSGGSGTQGDTCDASSPCGEGFDCLSTDGENFTCYGYCLLDDPDCAAGTTCSAIDGIPMWDDTGLCL